MWSEKYKPNNLKEFIGQDPVKLQILEFIKNFPKIKTKKALLLSGLSGSGKTALIYSIASSLEYEVIELNTSDLRNKYKIQNTIGQASKQKSLFSKGKLLLIDELEGIGFKDRGAITEISDLIGKSNWPMILITNNAWQAKLRPLIRKTVIIKIPAYQKETIVSILRKICSKEKLFIPKSVLENIALSSRGDIRAAINDLQSIAFFEKDSFGKVIDLREREETIFDALNKVFREQSAKYDAFDNINLDHDEIILWIDENLPLVYQGKELAEAYDALSRADVYRGRIRRRQYWRFLAYIYAMLTAGICSSKLTKKDKFINYKKPSRIIKIWLAKQKQKQKLEFAEKTHKIMHCSKKRAMKEYSFMKNIIK